MIVVIDDVPFMSDGWNRQEKGFQIRRFVWLHSSSQMHSLRARRVIIASLFLPDAAVLGDARPDDNLQKSKPASRIGSNLVGPLKSIVDDLKDKV